MHVAMYQLGSVRGLLSLLSRSKCCSEENDLFVSFLCSDVVVFLPSLLVCCVFLEMGVVGEFYFFYYFF